jgi:hypothetical protein
MLNASSSARGRSRAVCSAASMASYLRGCKKQVSDGSAAPNKQA